ncbi:hypothetical protein P3L10_029400 [Capsicum annuum]
MIVYLTRFEIADPNLFGRYTIVGGNSELLRHLGVTQPQKPAHEGRIAKSI